MASVQPVAGTPEKAKKFTYDVHIKGWTMQEVTVVLNSRSFEEGGMRVVFRLDEIEGQDRIPCVAKFFKKSQPEQYVFDEAMTQMVADSFAQEFNKRKVPKKVAFLSVSVLELPLRRALCTVEPLISGTYVKHNDNAGTVVTENCTPQAFSHFTYEHSNRSTLVCDIQGVGEFYTDPQIHSADGRGFGMGNLGKDGINRFIQTHVCNSICRGLCLPPLRGRETDEQLACRLQSQELSRQPGAGMRDLEAAMLEFALDKSLQSVAEAAVRGLPPGAELFQPRQPQPYAQVYSGGAKPQGASGGGHQRGGGGHQRR